MLVRAHLHAHLPTALTSDPSLPLYPEVTMELTR